MKKFLTAEELYNIYAKHLEDEWNRPAKHWDHLSEEKQSGWEAVEEKVNLRIQRHSNPHSP